VRSLARAGEKFPDFGALSAGSTGFGKIQLAEQTLGAPFREMGATGCAIEAIASLFYWQ